MADRNEGREPVWGWKAEAEVWRQKYEWAVCDRKAELHTVLVGGLLLGVSVGILIGRVIA